MNLVKIPPENVLDCWNLCDEFIKKACERGEDITPGELLADCIAGSCQLWFAWSDHLEAVAVTRIIETRCTLLACGGRGMNNWLGLLDEIEQWAALQGAKTLRIYGRPGWARKLPDYRIKQVVLDKDL